MQESRLDSGGIVPPADRVRPADSRKPSPGGRIDPSGRGVSPAGGQGIVLFA